MRADDSGNCYLIFRTHACRTRSALHNGEVIRAGIRYMRRVRINGRGVVPGIIGDMRVLVQRVMSASVSVNGEVVGSIRPAGQGLLALVGVTHSDDADTAVRMADKLWQLRILDGQLSAADTAAPILVISQFTLYANTTKGRRPTWNAAAPGSHAEPLVGVLAETLRGFGAEVQTGVFGADMQVESVNDGPVTVMLEI